MKTIGVFGSSQIKEGSQEWQIAFEVGAALAGAGFRVMNGGYAGIMEASAKGAKEAGGKTLGITTDEFKSKANQYIDDECRAPKWHERLFELMDRGDGFVVLDGGTGTLVELIVYWEMASKKFHAKPGVVLGENLKKTVAAIKENPEVIESELLHIASTPAEAVSILKEALFND